MVLFETIQKPSSFFESIGIHRIVALVSFLIFSSVSEDPSQWAETKPPLFFMIDLNSS